LVADAKSKGQDSQERGGAGEAASRDPRAPDKIENIVNKEHLQLSAEESFFLVFALGVLSVVDPATNSPLTPQRLLYLFRSYSYFPPRAVGASSQSLQPDDPFLVHYVVYHHFRSLGWVPRHGIKFGVDWLLYRRGPVFDHAEFGIIVMPSFSHPWWAEHGKLAPQKTWHWLHGINRVMSHVLKSLVLVYVDIPPPPVLDEVMNAADPDTGISEALKKYKIYEVMLRRWSANRNRS
jgi:tRNA-splicing endonuclease subunit Sen2